MRYRKKRAGGTVTKHCPMCGQEKPSAEFYVDRRREGALHTYCKACCRLRARRRYNEDREGHYRRHREWVSRNPDRVRLHKLKSAYGIPEEEYRRLPQVCVICGSRERLRLDHSHQSGRVRGLLCDSCNKALGFLGDDPTLALRAADYLLGTATADIFAATYEPVEAVVG